MKRSVFIKAAKAVVENKDLPLCCSLEHSFDELEFAGEVLNFQDPTGQLARSIALLLCAEMLKST